MKTFWKEHSRRKWTQISAAVYIIIILTTLFLLFLPLVLILLLFCLLQETEIDVCLNLNKYIYHTVVITFLSKNLTCSM